MKASKVAEIFSAMNPDDEVWFSYITKEDMKNNWEDLELEDTKGNPIQVTQYVTDENLKAVANGIDNDDSLWERFNETFRDTCNDTINELVAESNNAVDDEELWDTEGVTSEG
jgi:hypothetical protein